MLVLQNACLACVILASMSILPRKLCTCVVKFVYSVPNNIIIDGINGSSLNRVFLASPRPPMPTLLLYILTLEGNTSTSGVGWP